jgi:hypothetical protein
MVEHREGFQGRFSSPIGALAPTIGTNYPVKFAMPQRRLILPLGLIRFFRLQMHASYADLARFRGAQLKPVKADLTASTIETNGDFGRDPFLTCQCR